MISGICRLVPSCCQGLKARHRINMTKIGICIQLLTRESRPYINQYTYGTGIAGSRHYYYFLHYYSRKGYEGSIDRRSRCDEEAVLPSGGTASFFI